VSDCTFILDGGIERFIVLVGVEEMAELEDDLRHQLKEAEADIRNLKARLATVSTSRHCSHQCLRCAG
jgi:hypothetical protein